MTTIAFDGKIIAADSLCTDEDINFQFCKLYPYTDAQTKERFCMGGAGPASNVAPAFAWFMESGNPANWNNTGYEMLVACYDADEHETYATHIDPQSGCRLRISVPAAVGSGSDFAVGAMCMGASAIEALEVAAQRDHGTGGEIIAYDIEDGRWVRAPQTDSFGRLMYTIDPYLSSKNKLFKPKRKAPTRKRK